MTTSGAEIGPELDQLLEEFRADTAIGGPLLESGLPAPRCPINSGAAGVALAHWRLADVCGESGLLATARAWLRRAELDSGRTDAFCDGRVYTPAAVGRIALLHCGSGLALVAALIARSRADATGEQEATADFLDRINAACEPVDLALGRCSSVLGCALLLAGTDPAWPVSGRLRQVADALVAEIWETWSPRACPSLGIAHGWAGVLYATLLWSRVAGVHPPERARDLLDQLGRLAESDGRGLRWPRRADHSDARAYWSGWCNGQAGHVFLWTLASTVYDEPALLRHAQGAAWSISQAPAGYTSLCCGVAGEVYALLNVYRATEDETWLRRAITRASAAAISPVLAGDASSPVSLYKGHTGLALLAAELRHPERAAMPLFEPVG